MNQAQFAADYSEQFGVKFNPRLFIRTEDEIIEYLKRIILACERHRMYLIKVVGFKVVEDLDDIKQEIINYEKERFIRKNSKSKNGRSFDESLFNTIDLRDSAIKLLVVRYYVSINGEDEYFTVLIKVPRIVDKYYFKIYGKYYLALNQIIDGSTYNNSQASTAKTKKKQSISFRTIFMKTQMYRSFYPLKTTNKESLKLAYFTSSIFTKAVLTFKYIFARFGFWGGLDFMNMRDCVNISLTNPHDEDQYTFCRSNHPVYISCPKVLLDGQPVVQSLIYTLYKTLNKEETFYHYHLRSFWLTSIGSDFGNASVEKGLGILDSFENIFESIIHDGLHLPDEKKVDMYHIMKWIMGNYNELRQKNNHDISTKRIRWGLFLACHYSAHIANGLYRIADTNSKSSDYSIASIRKAIKTDPDILLKELSRGNKLVGSKNVINSDDAFSALKSSFKGRGGIGDSNKSAVPDSFRRVDPSHMDKIDLTYSSNNDPGMAPIICPAADIYNDSFSDYEEQNSWDEKFNQLIRQYRELKGQRDLFYIQKEFFDPDPKKIEILESTIPVMESMIAPWRIATEDEDQFSLNLVDINSLFENHPNICFE